MQIIENHDERPYEFPQASPDALGNMKALREQFVIIPWRNKDGSPSKVRVHDESLKAMKSDPVSAGWFGPGKLMVGAEPKDEEEAKSIPTAPPPPVKKKDAPKAA